MKWLEEFNYLAPPPVEQFKPVDKLELAEIIRKLRQISDRNPEDSAGYDDLDAACQAAELQGAFDSVILVAQDQDGYYFAVAQP